MLFHLISKIYENTSLLITTNLAFADWPQVFGDAKMTTAMLDRLTHHCDIVETGNESWRFKNRAQPPARHSRPAKTGSAPLCEAPRRRSWLPQKGSLLQAKWGRIWLRFDIRALVVHAQQLASSTSRAFVASAAHHFW